MEREVMAKRRTAAHIQADLKAVTRDVTKGLTVADNCRRHGITEQSYYRWRRRKADASGDTTVRLRELAVEGERLKQLLAEVMREVAQKSGDRFAAAGGDGVPAEGVPGVAATSGSGWVRTVRRCGTGRDRVYPNPVWHRARHPSRYRWCESRERLGEEPARSRCDVLAADRVQGEGWIDEGELQGKAGVVIKQEDDMANSVVLV